MPPKKKTSKPKSSTKGRRSQLAKDHDISAEQEREIQEAWELYKEDDVEGFEEEKEGVMPTDTVKLIMTALGIAPKSQQAMDEILEILDPESDGYVTYPHFVELAAVQINNKADQTQDEDVEEAFRLFTSGSDRAITFQDLRRIAGLLNQDISDDVLRAMILEANGGKNIQSGVNMEQFRDVMGRAGVFG